MLFSGFSSPLNLTHWLTGSQRRC